MAVLKKGPVLRVTGLAASQSDGELAVSLTAALKTAISDSLTNEEQSEIDVGVTVIPSRYSR
jgi:hypothetical protein